MYIYIYIYIYICIYVYMYPCIYFENPLRNISDVVWDSAQVPGLLQVLVRVKNRGAAYKDYLQRTV